VKALYLTLALAAGLAGGILSRFVGPQPVRAQAQASPEIRAQRFILEDASGRTLGTFSVEMARPGDIARGASGSIRLFDERGREVWRTPSRGILPATE